jgi:CRISP-associated protein Cas1
MAILPSHKEGVLYLEHCAVRASDDRLAFIRKKDAIEQHFSIPSKNVAVLLLGPGTSLTQQAARLCAEGQMLVGFCAGGATPVYLASLNEYREPSYSRNWIARWQGEPERLAMAKRFQHIRSDNVLRFWPKALEAGPGLADSVQQFREGVDRSRDVSALLLEEARFTQSLYRLASAGAPFSRQPRSKEDGVNEWLDASNYLAYGLAATCLWVLGIPFSYPVVHGKTRRGALVFDVADLVKDALVLPQVFLATRSCLKASDCRVHVIAALHDANALGLMFDAVLAECRQEPILPTVESRPT